MNFCQKFIISGLINSQEHGESLGKREESDSAKKWQQKTDSEILLSNRVIKIKLIYYTVTYNLYIMEEKTLESAGDPTTSIRILKKV